MTSEARKIEQTGAKELGQCECCGNRTRRVWGFVHRGTATEAAYFVQWTPGGILRHGARFDLIIGPWGSETSTADRVGVSLAFRRVASEPQFMLVDADEGLPAANTLVGRTMNRDDVLNSPLAEQAFAIVDAIWLQDERIEELTSDAA